MSSNITPINIEVNPINRMWLSLISIIFLNASRQVCGDKKGSIPSKININAIAIRKFSHIITTHFTPYRYFIDWENASIQKLRGSALIEYYQHDLRTSLKIKKLTLVKNQKITFFSPLSSVALST